MKTLHFSPSLQEEDLLQMKELLLQGEVIAFPTETVFGLAVDWQNEKAIEKLFELKKRPSNNPMTLHLSSIEMAEELAVDIPSSFYKLTRHFWPGALTIILKKNARVSERISKEETIGLRMPNHSITLPWIEKMGGILLGTSANLSGMPPCLSLEEVMVFFEGKIAAIIDGKEGSCKRASTVLSLVSKPPRIFREGPITKKQIEEVLEEKILLL
jgi:L-threonylcarbamoyladenylate synthase